MSNVLVMTDSVACIPKNLQEQYNIKVVPAAIILFEGKSFIDGETITAEEAYELIRKNPDKFSTVAITPEYLYKVYEELIKKTNNILFITISSALSAVCKTASIAAEMIKEKYPEATIRILDSMACASTQGLVVLAAAKAALAGKTIDEVYRIALKVREKTGGLMMLDTLRYVYRTGRMSKTASQILSFFNIKPINRITEDGKVEMVYRVRKRHEGINYLLDKIRKEAGTDKLHFMITHASAPEVANGFSEELRGKLNELSLIISDFSPVMGYGAGPGAIFIGFHPDIDLSKDE